MSTFIRGIKFSKKGLKVSLFALIVLLCVSAITFGIIYSQKQNLVVTPENDLKLEMLDEASILSANGWNSNIATKLSKNLSSVGDNVALGNAGGDMVGNVISLGGYTWLVVYKQNGIITLYANEPVAYLKFDSKSNVYSESAVRDFLNNTFYQNLISKVNYSGFENLIVPYGSDDLYYQVKDAQSVPLKTLANGDILNSNGVANDLVWLPSALEVGGFATTENSPKQRVNSFRTIQENGFSINSGLWNLSNNSRLAVNDCLLRSSVDNGVAVIKNGLITKGDINYYYAIRPCLNIVMPNINNSEILLTNANYNSSAVLSASVVPDFTDELALYADYNSTNKTFTVTDAIKGIDFLVALSDAVKAGQNFSGYTIKLNVDIDMTPNESTSTKVTVWDPIGREDFAFKGTFNGQGHKISNLASSGSGLVGLFGYTNGATIQNVAVVNSSWYTDSSNVGGIVGTAVNTTISQCYNEAGIAGADYVGGIVGNMTGGTLSNCYNIHGIIGANYVGGIAGNNTGAISTCYNVGVVSATSNGNAVANGGTISNCANYPSNTIADMIGTKTLVGGSIQLNYNTTIYSGFDMSTIWTFSNVYNDRLPILRVFNANATHTINLKTNGVGGSDNSVSYAINGNNVVVTATVSWTTGKHYKVNAWRLYDILPTETGDYEYTREQVFATPTEAVGSPTYKITIPNDDSYNIQVDFEKMYALTVTPVFNGFNSATPSVASSITYENITASTQKWFVAGDTATITIGANQQYQFTNFTGSQDGGNTYSAITIGSFITQSGTTYTFNLGNSNAYNGNDEYLVKANFTRLYNVAVSTNPASGITQSAVKITANGTDTTAGNSKVISYNSSIVASVTGYDTEANQYKFKEWQLNGTKVNTPSSFTIGKLADDVYDVALTAVFEQTQKVITVTENENSGGVVVLTTDANYNIASASTDVSSITIGYGVTYYLFIKPNYASGYELANTEGFSVDANGNYNRSFVANYADTTYAHTVNYQEIRFTMSFNVYLDGTKTTSAEFTTPGNLTDLSKNQSLSGYNVAVDANVANKYFMNKVISTYNSKTKEIVYAAGGNGYQGATSYQIYTSATSITDLNSLLSTCGGIVYNQKAVTVDLYFISITRQINITQKLTTKNTNGTDVIETLTGVTYYELEDTTANNKITDNVGILNNTHTITVKCPAGVKAVSVVIANTTNTIATPTWGDTTSSFEFTLSGDTQIVINFTKSSYQVTITDNLGSLTGIDATPANAYAYVLNSGTKTTANSLWINYGDTLSIQDYTILFENVGTSKAKVRLDKIEILANSGATTIKTITDLATCSHTFSEVYNDVNIKFTYSVLKAVTVKLTKEDGANLTTNAVLVEFVNIATNERLIEIVSIGDANGAQFYCRNGEDYKIRTVIPIFVKVQYTGATLGSSYYYITATEGAEITVDLQLAVNNNTIYGSEDI